MLSACAPEDPDQSYLASVRFDAPLTHQVEAGDTLESVAKRFGVTAADIASWNPESRFAEGDVVLVFSDGEVQPAPAAPQPTSPKPRRTSSQKGRCKAQRTDAADGTMVGARGLSQSQIARALRGRLGGTRRCLPADAVGHYAVLVEIDVGCDGRVTNTYTQSRGGLTESQASCIERVFRRVRFPAHDRPDGQAFQYPLTIEI